MTASHISASSIFAGEIITVKQAKLFSDILRINSRAFDEITLNDEQSWPVLITYIRAKLISHDHLIELYYFHTNFSLPVEAAAR